MPFKIVRNDITKMNTEAIVNTANTHAAVGTGCDSAVYKAAGYEELLRYRGEQIGSAAEGDVFITPGFHLHAKYIIHAVSPRYIDGNQGEEEKLRSCYRKSLELAKTYRIHSIAFPLISTGGFGYPKEVGMRIAIDEIHAFLMENDMMIYLVVFDETSTALGGKLYPELEAYIDNHYVEDKSEQEYCYSRSAYMMDGARKGAGIEPEECRILAPVPDEEDEDFSEECFYFEEEDESALEERMQHISDTFSEYLLYLIGEKKMENAEVWKRAIVDKKVFSKMKNNPDYHPQKRTALCLCVGAKLNLDETRDLLARAGYALSPCDKTDIIFSYFIEHEIYDMIELDIQLEEHGLPCIIS